MHQEEPLAISKSGPGLGIFWAMNPHRARWESLPVIKGELQLESTITRYNYKL